MIAEAMPSVACTMMGASALGSMWRKIRRLLEAPTARVASTKSTPLTVITEPRTTRA